jgi:hypothetical protein
MPVCKPTTLSVEKAFRVEQCCESFRAFPKPQKKYALLARLSLQDGYLPSFS